ncbi:MAG: cupin domain-containing protein [Burkholderiales bacterium]|nr:cupin domain-containing protein [Burkholderiales bacterium]
MRNSLLGGLSPRDFLARHWQRRPLLVRGAVPEFHDLADHDAIERLAMREDVESRLVERRGARWTLEHGPLTRAQLRRRARSGWTVLVSGLNLHLASAERLLRRFGFIPQARLDDLMVSIAAPGGGVGPHEDAYDVFLLQGGGRRRWRLCRPRAFSFVPDAPLRLIENFEAEDELLAEPGDLLYLPPGWGHDGVALEPCTTYSIGFRAPLGDELAAAFLDWLHARGLPRARYRDAGLRASRNPARVPSAMIDYAAGTLARIRWSRRDVARFLGEYLSAPKPQIVFRAPRRPLGQGAFDARLRRATVALDARTRLLALGGAMYLNGERLALTPARRRALSALADARRLSGARLARAALGPLLYGWYRLGYLHLETGR